MNNGLYNRSWGVEWSGTEGNIILNDEGWEIRTEKKQANLDNQRKPGSPDPRPAHVRNFLDCVKSRQQPVLNLDIGHHVSTVAHLGNIAYRTGRKIVWDAANQKSGRRSPGRQAGRREVSQAVETALRPTGVTPVKPYGCLLGALASLAKWERLIP